MQTSPCIACVGLIIYWYEGCFWFGCLAYFMGTIRDRKCIDLTETENIKKCGKNTQKTVQKRSS